MKREAFREFCEEFGNQNYQQRYYVEEVAERFQKFKPGNISVELQEALGISDRQLPPYIYRMRQLGYPRGWLKEAELESSGLSLYDGKDSSDGDIVEEAMPKKIQVSYDVSKLISFPGFNTPAHPGVSDDWREFGSIPMQPDQQKEVLANYLRSNFPDPQYSAAQKRQKMSGNGQGQSSEDVDIASDQSYCFPSQRFKFQSPLSPGSPYNTPPSLSRGTPPPTPTNFIPPPPPTPTPPPLPKGTPPPTPPCRSFPLLPSGDGFPLQAKVVNYMDEDTLTLEEEEQRSIWAALENAESTHSESDVHTQLNESILEESNENVPLTTEEESFNKDPNEDAPIQEMVVTEPIDKTNEEKTCAAKDVIEEAAYVDPSFTSTRLPDRSKFAESITPNEFKNMSESTGTYRHLRDVLKNSPRSQQKNKQGM